MFDPLSYLMGISLGRQLFQLQCQLKRDWKETQLRALGKTLRQSSTIQCLQKESRRGWGDPK